MIVKKDAKKLPHAFIVEDETLLSNAFKIALEDAGYTVEVIADGQVALERLETESPDLLLLDLHLPKVNGADILNSVQNQTIHKNMRIFLATADAQLGRVLEDKVDLLLEKPVGFFSLSSLASRFKPGQSLNGQSHLGGAAV